MLLYYAMGGGWGHMTRASIFISQIGLFPSECLVISPHPPNDAPPQNPDITFLQIPNHLVDQPKRYHQWLTDLINHYDIQEIYLDSFPLGIIGEWTPFFQRKDLKFHYIARLLNWEVYQTLGSPPLPQFEKTWIIEPLQAAQKDFIRANSHRVAEISLAYPAPKPENAEKLMRHFSASSPIWLVVHSGPPQESEEIMLFAKRQMRLEKERPLLLVISPITPPPVLREQAFWFNYYPARDLYPRVGRIFTAAGFNSIQETRAFAQKHHCLPLFR
ncbi:MAG: hypothetical protein AAFU64_01475, partial [Bacteroidota bacterium]